MLKFRETKLLFLSLLLLLFLIGASFVLAQKPLEVAYPEIPGALTPTTTKTALPDYIRYIFQFSLFLAALIAFGSFVYGGVRYLTSAGSPAAQRDAKDQITAGALGLLILTASFVILNTINPQLTAFKVSLPGLPREGVTTAPPKATAATHVEIPLGGLIENLWGVGGSPASKPVQCYQFDGEGDRTTVEPLENQERLDCIKWLSKAIKIKAKKLRDPVVELGEFYNGWNCCEDNCQNACDWNAGTEQWENCGAYASCEGQSRDATKNWCRAVACDYFPACTAGNCDAIPFQGPSTICRYPDTKEPCSYEDLIIQEKINRIQETLLEFQVKMGFFPLTEKLRSSDNLNWLLSDENTKNLIKNLLFYQEPGYSQIDTEKLKTILKTKEVMTYLIEEYSFRNLLLSNQNVAKTMLKAMGLLENEVAINEIAWMGTKANENQEWLELYNNTKGDISLDGWQLRAADGSPTINLSGQISAQGFYLLENNEETTDISADLVYSGNLDNNGEILELSDQFGNLVEKIDSSAGWFAGDETTRTTMERINPQKDGSDSKNWLTNLSIEVEKKEDLINGKDQDGNPILGTPKNPNSVGVAIVSYSALDGLVSDLKTQIEGNENLKEKLLLVIRKDENLERLLKTKEFLVEVLAGEDERLKKLLQEREVLRTLLEDRTKLNVLLADNHALEVFRAILDMAGPEKEAAWQDLITNKLKETITNSKLISQFQRDLLWVLDARDLMRNCEEDPLSIDQARVPDLIPNLKIEQLPEWEKIKREVKFPGETEAGHDPAIFYCYKPLW